MPVPREQTYFECLISRHVVSSDIPSESNWLIQRKMRRISLYYCHMNDIYIYRDLNMHIHTSTYISWFYYRLSVLRDFSIQGFWGRMLCHCRTDIQTLMFLQPWADTSLSRLYLAAVIAGGFVLLDKGVRARGQVLINFWRSFWLTEPSPKHYLAFRIDNSVCEYLSERSLKDVKLEKKTWTRV